MGVTRMDVTAWTASSTPVMSYVKSVVVDSIEYCTVEPDAAAFFASAAGTELICMVFVSSAGAAHSITSTCIGLELNEPDSFTA